MSKQFEKEARRARRRGRKLAAKFINICLEICGESEAVQEAYGHQLDDLAPWLGMEVKYDAAPGGRIDRGNN